MISKSRINANGHCIRNHVRTKRLRLGCSELQMPTECRTARSVVWDWV